MDFRMNEDDLKKLESESKDRIEYEEALKKMTYDQRLKVWNVKDGGQGEKEIKRLMDEISTGPKVQEGFEDIDV